MITLLDENLVDKELKNWIIPAFSTITRDDKIVSAMLMMACMKSYFTFIDELMCGIPSVILEVIKDDWIDILNRLEKLDTWDEKTVAWHFA